MMGWLRKTVNKKYFCLFVLFVLMLVFHLGRQKYGDDVIFGQYSAAAGGLSNFLNIRLSMWTSRFIFETICVGLSRCAFGIELWAVLDSFFITLLAYSTIRIFEIDDKRTIWLTAAMMPVLFYPQSDMMMVGWIATTVNYVWTSSLCVFAILPLCKLYRGEKVRFYEYFAYLPAVIFAANSELTGLILAAFFLIGNVLITLKRKRVSAYAAAGLLIVLAMVIYAFFINKGNDYRYAIDWRLNFQEWGMLTFGEKIYNALSSTFSRLLFSVNMPFWIFLLLLSYGAFQKADCTKKRVAALLPATLVFACNMFTMPFWQELFPNLSAIITGMYKGSVTVMNFRNAGQYLPVALSVALTIMILIEIFEYFDDKREACAASLIFLAGLCSRLAVCFTPSVYASGTRTFFFMDIGFALLAVYIWSRKGDALSRRGGRFYGALYYAVMAVSAVSYLSTLSIPK